MICCENNRQFILLDHGLEKGGQGDPQDSPHVSLILKDFPSSNEFPQWDSGQGVWGGEQSKNKTSLYSPSVPQGKLNQIYI